MQIQSRDNEAPYLDVAFRQPNSRAAFAYLA